MGFTSSPKEGWNRGQVERVKDRSWAGPDHIRISFFFLTRTPTSVEIRRQASGAIRSLSLIQKPHPTAPQAGQATLFCEAGTNRSRTGTEIRKFESSTTFLCQEREQIPRGVSKNELLMSMPLTTDLTYLQLHYNLRKHVRTYIKKISHRNTFFQQSTIQQLRTLCFSDERHIIKQQLPETD